MPKMTFKNAFFRIFWKIPAKTSPETLYLCGFPEASVEMRVAPFRALPQETVRTWATSIFVEMRVAPFRALPQYISDIYSKPDFGRNAGRPFQGIATRHGSCSCRSECDWKKCTSPHSGHIKTVHPWRSRARLFIPFPYNRSIPSPHVQNMKSPSARIKSSTETPTNTDEHQHTSTYPDRTLLL